MRIECEKCSAAYTIGDALLSDQPIGAQCPYCGHVKIVQKSDAVGGLPELDLGPSNGSNRPRGRADAPVSRLPPFNPSASTSSPGGGGGALDLNLSLDDRPPDEFFERSDRYKISDRPGALGTRSDPLAPEPLDLGLDADSRTGSAGEARCQVCGAELVDEFDKVIGLCEMHQRERGHDSQPAAGRAAGEWHVRSADTSETMLSLAELRSALQRGSITPDARVSRDGERFGAIEDFPELREFAKPRPASQVQRPVSVEIPRQRTFIAPARRARPSIGGLAIVLLIVLGIGGAAGAFLAFEPDRARELYDQYLGAAPVDAPRPPNPLRPSLDKWRSTISDVTGTPEEHLLAARTLHLGDSNESYSAANEALQRALLLDEDNTAVIGNWVENLMLWKLGAVPVDQIRLADEALKYAGALSPNEPAVFRGRAAIALARGDLNGCRSWAEKAIAADGSDVRARLLMASSYVEGNGQLAIQEAEQALRANPKLLRAERLLARAYADAGRYASAQRLIDKRIKDDSENAEVNILAGDVQRELGDLSAAEQRYRAATEDKGGSVRALLSLGDLLVEVGNHNEAMKFYRRVLSSKEVLPEHEAEANAGLARAELDRGRWKPAGKFAERAIEKDPRNAAALVALAEVELQSGSATTASSVAKQALDSQGGEPAALVIMGRAAIKQNQPDRALKHFEEAIHNEPRDPRLKSIMAAMYLHFGGSSQAFAVMRKVADMDPEQGVSRQRKRAIPLPVAAQTEAIDEFRKATTEARNRSVAYSSMAILYYHLHDTARAYEAIGNALESDDSNRAALLYQAQLSLERGQLDKAFQAAKLILDIDRASAMGHLMHARVLGKKGQVKEAEDEYDAAVRSEPGLMIAKVEMAGLSLKRGRKDEALQTLAEAYRLYPHMVATRRLLLEAGY